jgi:hypothetical protein
MQTPLVLLNDTHSVIGYHGFFKWVPCPKLQATESPLAYYPTWNILFLIARGTMSAKSPSKISPRSRGGQPGNRNAWKHGHRSRHKVRLRAQLRARLKVLAFIGEAHGVFGKSKVRNRPLRQDQIELLMKDPVFSPWVRTLFAQRDGAAKP